MLPMYFNYFTKLMFDYSLVRYVFLYFIFVFYLSIVCHTVNSTDLVPSQNESLSKDIKNDQFKRGDSTQEDLETKNNSKNISMNGNKIATPTSVHNETMQTSPSLIEDEINSTASLPSWMLNIKDGALQRTGYVAIGFMSIVLLFFVVRAVRHQKRVKNRKYGIITSTASDLEMEPLDRDDDEEEDTTLFDAQHKYSLQ